MERYLDKTGRAIEADRLIGRVRDERQGALHVLAAPTLELAVLRHVGREILGDAASVVAAAEAPQRDQVGGCKDDVLVLSLFLLLGGGLFLLLGLVLDLLATLLSSSASFLAANSSGSLPTQPEKPSVRNSGMAKRMRR